MNAAAEFRVLLGVVAAIGAVGTASGLAGITDHTAAASLAAAALGWLAALVMRRELRIRARLADPHTRPAPDPFAGAPCSRVVPGEHTPAPPAPTHQPAAVRVAGSALTDPIPDRTGGAR